MQTYEPARRAPHPSAIPAMRHAPERTRSQSATPIYDALYAEYRMAFRTLPGDRSGEEDIGFKTFAALGGFNGRTGFTTGLHGTGPLPQAGPRRPGPWQDVRQLPGPAHPGPPAPPQWTPVAPAPSRHPDRPGGYQTGVWRPVRRPGGPQDLLPAVLPRHPAE